MKVWPARGFLATAALTACAVLAGSGNADPSTWTKVAHTENASVYYATALLVRKVDGALRVGISASANRAGARVDGSVSCVRNFNFESYKFDYPVPQAKVSWRTYRISPVRGNCTVLVSMQNSHGGSIGLTLYQLR